MLPNPASDVTVAGRLGTAGDDGVAATPGDQPGGVADGVGAGGARRADRLVGALQAVAHRDRRPAGVGHHHRDEERRDTPFALLDAHIDLFLEGLETADPGGEDRAETSGIDTDVPGGLPSPRRRQPWRTARRGRRDAPPWGCRTRATGSQSAKRTDLPDVMPGPSKPSQNASTPIPHGATTPRPVTATRRPRPSISPVCRRSGRMPDRRSRLLRVLLRVLRPRTPLRAP